MRLNTTAPLPQLQCIPAFSDNYIWLLHDGQHAWVVDPGDAGPVRAALQEQGLILAGILLTHHHHDHTGSRGSARIGDDNNEKPGDRHHACSPQEIHGPST